MTAEDRAQKPTPPEVAEPVQRSAARAARAAPPTVQRPPAGTRRAACARALHSASRPMKRSRSAGTRCTARRRRHRCEGDHRCPRPAGALDRAPGRRPRRPPSLVQPACAVAWRTTAGRALEGADGAALRGSGRQGERHQRAAITLVSRARRGPRAEGDVGGCVASRSAGECRPARPHRLGRLRKERWYATEKSSAACAVSNRSIILAVVDFMAAPAPQQVARAAQVGPPELGHRRVADPLRQRRAVDDIRVQQRVDVVHRGQCSSPRNPRQRLLALRAGGHPQVVRLVRPMPVRAAAADGRDPLRSFRPGRSPRGGRFAAGGAWALRYIRRALDPPNLGAMGNRRHLPGAPQDACRRCSMRRWICSRRARGVAASLVATPRRWRRRCRHCSRATRCTKRTAGSTARPRSSRSAPATRCSMPARRSGATACCASWAVAAWARSGWPSGPTVSSSARWR